MTVSGGNTNSGRRVGDRVQLSRPGGVDVTGKLVEDFASFLIGGDQLGRDWAAPHRWAIALDDGTLVFADDDDLTAVTSPDTTDSAVSGTASAAVRDTAPGSK